MFADRNQIRQYYCEIFAAHERGEAPDAMGKMVLDIILLHPEYHDMLRDTDASLAHEFTAEQGQTNPFLHMGMHLAIREQVSIDRPAGIAAAHAQLAQKAGISDAEHQIIECLGRMLWESHTQNAPPDEAEYLNCVRKLL